jgi:signal transduction histidine kinase
VSRADLPLEPVELARVVAQAKAQLRESHLEPPHDWLTVDGSLPRVQGHAATLVQVVVNLLSNAIKFVPPGVAPRVRVWAEARDGRVRLWIEDQGIGVAPEHQARIFRVFERLHGAESYPGTGIGLAIVARGVERMGGRVGVESTAGQGSRFWIEFPAA